MNHEAKPEPFTQEAAFDWIEGLPAKVRLPILLFALVIALAFAAGFFTAR